MHDHGSANRKRDYRNCEQAVDQGREEAQAQRRDLQLGPTAE
jgi:hypothetical protein